MQPDYVLFGSFSLPIQDFFGAVLSLKEAIFKVYKTITTI
jgi:hypothetical protein